MGEIIMPTPKEEPAEEPGNDTGEKKEGDGFKYVFAAQFVRTVESSGDGRTVTVLVNVWSGDPQIFHGGGAESLRPYFVEMSREGYEAFREAGSGEIGIIVANKETSDGTVWITRAALKAKSKENEDPAA